MAHTLTVVLETQTQILAATAKDRRGLKHDILKILNTCGLIPSDVSTRVDREHETVDLAVSVNGADKQLLGAQAILESQLGIMFDPFPPGARIGHWPHDTTRLRIEADFGKYGPGAWMLITRGGDWVSSGARVSADLAPHADVYVRESFEAGMRGTLQRLLCHILGWNANLLFLEAHENWEGTSRSGVDAIFHLPAYHRDAKRVLQGYVQRFCTEFGVTLIALEDLDMPGDVG
jgi:hypothetical protein